MFTITGPGSPSVLGNMMVAIEQHVEWIIDCIKHMNANDKKEIEADLTAENEWMDLVEIIASSTLRDTCNSWYVGANVPGKKRVFMPYAGGYQTYREKCDEIAKTNRATVVGAGIGRPVFKRPPPPAGPGALRSGIERVGVRRQLETKLFLHAVNQVARQ